MPGPALWALFKDSVEGIVDRRLLDKEATAAAIRTALDASLRAATPGDTVVIYFAGHGTPGHQLVPFDTDLCAVGQTTIPMQEIADRLKSTKARASLVILDCCFSGERRLASSKACRLPVPVRRAPPTLVVMAVWSSQQLRTTRKLSN